VVNEHQHSWWDVPVSALKLSAPVLLKSNATFSEAIEALKKNHVNQLPMIDEEDGSIVGVVGQETLINQIVSMNRPLSAPAIKAANKRPIRLSTTAILGKLARILEVDPCVLIVDNEAGKDTIKGLATKLDIMSFIASEASHANGTNGNH